jgi:hypothetical protein
VKRTAPRPRKRGALRRVGRALAYGASIPERTVRVVAAAAGGASRLATDTVLPRSFRRTNLYRFFIGNFQRFLIEDVGRVNGTYRGFSGKLPKDFLARKTVGDFVEAAGILALAYSPLWFFALISGAASGSRTFLDRVVEELKKDGHIHRKSRIKSAEELLKALEGASLATTVPFDQPPLSIKDLAGLRRRLSREYKKLFRRTRKTLPDALALWKRFLEVRRERKISFLKLSGVMSVASARAAGRATSALFRENVVRSYADSLGKVRRSGPGDFFAHAAQPYVQAIADAYKPRTPTVTERLLIRKKKKKPVKRRRASRSASSALPIVPMS